MSAPIWSKTHREGECHLPLPSHWVDRKLKSEKSAWWRAKLRACRFLTDAVPVAELGEADGHRLDAIIGARTMEQWEIRLDPSTGELDLEGLRRREFKEW